MTSLTVAQKIEGVQIHVQHELDTFIWAYNRIHWFLNGDKVAFHGDKYEKRGVHECFLLHARNLHDFLWIPSKRDDIAAIEYGVSLVRPQDHDFENIFGELKGGGAQGGRINKQLSHLTFSRTTNDQIDLFNESEKVFDWIMKGFEEYNLKVSEEYKVKVTELSL